MSSVTEQTRLWIRQVKNRRLSLIAFQWMAGFISTREPCLLQVYDVHSLLMSRLTVG